jgi:DNA-binding MarR family transcriptional regulator
MVDFSRSRTIATASQEAPHAHEAGHGLNSHGENARLKAKVPPALADNGHNHDLGLDDDLAGLVKAIRVIAQAIDTRSKSMARLSGLTIPQLVVLAGIRDLGEVTTNGLSRHVDLSPGTVVAILDKLAERGFIERYRSPTDRRIVHSRLTEAGVDILARSPGLLPGETVAAIAALPQPEREKLVAAFRSVASMLRTVA